MQFFHQPNIDFVGKRKIFLTMSVSLAVLGILLTFIFPPKFGIDFTGGTEVGVEFQDPLPAESVREVINNEGFTTAEIKSFGSPKSFLIRVKESGESPDRVKNALNQAFPDNPHETLKVDKIGPKIGQEMRGQAILAIIISVLAITLYIAFRFEFNFGLAAIVALIHDVIIAFSMIVIFQLISPFSLEIDQTILAGMLTVVGFSINDTVIVFDRVRENRDTMKGKTIVQIFNKSINETLSRTINTTLSAELVLLILLFFGGPTLEGFAFTMFIGFLVGTFSSIFVATPFVLWYLAVVKKVDIGEVPTTQTATT